jgi:O-antigen/teichoic acid export membrane protein
MPHESPRGRAVFVRMFSGAVAIQGMLSASSFIVGLLLVRRTSNAEYGYYVLITSAILLATSVQWSLISPPMVIRMNAADQAGRADLIGGLRRDQLRLLPWLLVVVTIAVLVLWASGLVDAGMAVTVIAGALAMMAALHRDFLRSVLFAYHRPNDVLRSDFVYCLLLVAGAFIATLFPLSAAIAALGVLVGCIAGCYMLGNSVRRHEPWNSAPPPGTLRAIASAGALSALGSGIHWSFSQGYNYLVAGTLDINAVAALAATRMFVMPVNLLSTGIGTLMFPTTARWLRDIAPGRVFGRLVLVSSAMALASGCYLLCMWLGRDWVFDRLLKKHFLNDDTLVLLWVAISLVMIFRDQLLHLLVAKARFHLTSSLTAVSAVISISCSIVAMRHHGPVGALIGLLIGEVFNVVGIVILSLRDVRAAVTAPPIS